MYIIDINQFLLSHTLFIPLKSVLPGFLISFPLVGPVPAREALKITREIVKKLKSQLHYKDAKILPAGEYQEVFLPWSDLVCLFLWPDLLHITIGYQYKAQDISGELLKGGNVNYVLGRK